MKKLFPLLALACILGCGKPAGKPGAPTTPPASTPADANQSTGEKVADSLQDISNTIRNVQALTQNVKNIKGLQIVPERIHWEYKIISPKDAEISLESRLNNLGNEGWELSASTPKGNFIFKRPKQEKK